MTTTILHRNGFGASDTRSSNHNITMPVKTQKIFKVRDPITKKPHTLLTYAGAAGLHQLIQELLVPKLEDSFSSWEGHPATHPDITREYLCQFQYEHRELDDDSRVILLVDDHKRLFSIDSAGTELELDSDFYAVGSGWEFAYGYLGALQARQGALFLADLAEAIAFTAKIEQCTGGSIDSVMLGD